MQSLLNKFNMQTYLNVLIVEQSEAFTTDLEKHFDLTNDNLKPMYPLTMRYCMSVLGSELYLEEIGDKLIKLSI